MPWTLRRRRGGLDKARPWADSTMDVRPREGENNDHIGRDSLGIRALPVAVYPGWALDASWSVFHSSVRGVSSGRRSCCSYVGAL